MDCCCQASTQKSRLIIKKAASSRFGGHVGLQDSLFETVLQSGNSSCCQFFLGSPQTLKCRSILEEDRSKAAKLCTETDRSFYIHCPYIVNLSKEGCEKDKELLNKELDTVTGLPGACVLHIGRRGTIEQVAESINEIERAGHLRASTSSRVPFHLLLEIAAGQGTELGTTWKELRHLYEALDKTKVGLCIDTQHAFASGLCDFSSHESVVSLYSQANDLVRHGISMLHLNDSARPFNSRVDRHAPLREGYIWSSDIDSLKSLISIARDYNLDVISETSNPRADLQLLHSLKNE